MDQRQQDELIRQLHQLGHSYAQIKKLAHVGTTRIHQVITGAHIPGQRGRPPICDEHMRLFIEAQFLKNARLTDGDVKRIVLEKHGVNVSRQTICRIRNEFHIYFRPPITIQALTDEQKDLRIQFAQDTLQKLEETPTPIVFSDESRFCICPDNGYVRYRRGEWNITACQPKKKFPTGVMFWGAIGTGYKSRLVACSGGVGAQEYQKIVEDSQMVQIMNEKVGRYQWYFMQDGAPCHSAKATVDALLGKCLILEGWPPNSPDLNPIEMLWAIIKRELMRREVRDDGDLAAAVTDIWNNLPQEMIDAMIDSFKQRLQMVLEMQGGSISGLLSAHMLHPKEAMIVTHEYRPFTAEEDREIMALHRRFANRWTVISQHLSVPRTKNEVKNRVIRIRLGQINMEHRREAEIEHLDLEEI